MGRDGSRASRRPSALWAATLLAAAIVVPGSVLFAGTAAAEQPDDRYSGVPGEILVTDPLANDTGNNSLMGTVVTGPEHGTLSIATGGTFGTSNSPVSVFAPVQLPTYLPDAGFQGLDQFRYTSTRTTGSGSESYTATVFLTVADIDDCGSPTVPDGYAAQVVQAPADDVAGTATATVDVPAGVEQVRLDLCGARGGPAQRGGPGSFGATTTAVLSILPAERARPHSFTVIAGSAGVRGRMKGAFGGGGPAGGSDSGGGGGGSFIYLDGKLLAVAGGAGGDGGCDSAGSSGGGGGGMSGGPASGSCGPGGGGGSAMSPGAGGSSSSGSELDAGADGVGSQGGGRCQAI